jgi:hypothetical protein
MGDVGSLSSTLLIFENASGGVSKTGAFSRGAGRQLIRDTRTGIARTLLFSSLVLDCRYDRLFGPDGELVNVFGHRIAFLRTWYRREKMCGRQ